jgi:uncharacterized damage-inducible protein DinB
MEEQMSTTPNLSLSDLMAYTDWERDLWHGWLQQHGDGVLAITAGPHGDGRFQTIGDLVRHIFSAEKRYVERLSNRPITDTSAVPNNNVEALFDFGRQSRDDLRQFMKTFPPENWDVPQDLSLMNKVLRLTPRKIMVHVLLHETRHWAQIGTLFRLNGLTGEFHDFLFSPVLAES